MRHFYKLQIRNGTTGTNHVDEVLKDGRITSHIDYAGVDFEKLNKGDVLLIHKGSNPVCLVEVLYKITNKNEINGTDFGINYRVKILSYFGDLEESLSFKKNNSKIGPNGTFTHLYNDSKTLQFIKEWFDYIQRNENMENIKAILEYKKQIILQGPPGTGKTRLAKMIAQEILKPLEIEVDDILFNLSVNQKITTSSGSASFSILSLDKDILTYKRESTGEIGGLKYTDIKKAYKNKIWVNNNIKNGSDTYSGAVAKYLYQNYNSNRCKLIQFHPAFSYEDFVRGITTKVKNNAIEYITQDRSLIKLAKEAYNNYINSRKPIVEYSKEIWVDEQFNLFKEMVIEALDDQGFFTLTPNVSIVEVEDDAFRYVGDTWQTQNPHRMRFNDIKIAYLSGNQTRQELKNNPLVSGSAFQHATYYFKILQEFKNSLQAPIPNNFPTLNNNTLKSYVLIIDEINRANLPSVLGELIYALEYRGEIVEGVYDIEGDNSLIIPPNLYIIGTMNTADRSVGHIDYAIKRRFSFVDVLPEIEPVHPLMKNTFIKISSLFIKDFDGITIPSKKEKSNSLASDFRPEDIWIGHSYFICKKENSNENEDDAIAKPILNMKLKYEIIPLLKEYIKDGILNETEQVKNVMDELISTNF